MSSPRLLLLGRWHPGSWNRRRQTWGGKFLRARLQCDLHRALLRSPTCPWWSLSPSTVPSMTKTSESMTDYSMVGNSWFHFKYFVDISRNFYSYIFRLKIFTCRWEAKPERMHSEGDLLCFSQVHQLLCRPRASQEGARDRSFLNHQRGWSQVLDGWQLWLMAGWNGWQQVSCF